MDVSRKKANLLTAICSMVYFASYFTRKDLSAATAGLIAAGFLDKTDAGRLGTVLFICYGIGQIFSGALGDRFDPKKLILIGIGASTVCNAVFPFITNTWILTVIWAINGFAQSLLWPPIVKILSSELPHEKFVKANMVVTIAAHASTVLLYLYVPACLEIWDWRSVFFGAAIIASVSFIAFFFALRNVMVKKGEKQGEIIETVSNADIKATLLKAGIIPILIATVAQGFLRDGVDAWLPTLYSEVFGRSASESVLVSVIIPIFSILSVYIVTALHKIVFRNEIFGSVILFIIGGALFIPLYFLLGTESSFGRILCLILAALSSATNHGINFLILCCLPGRFAKAGRAATVTGLCNAFTYLGAAASGYGIAFAAEKGGWNIAVIALFAVSVLGIAMCFVSYKPYKKFIAKNRD